STLMPAPAWPRAFSWARMIAHPCTKWLRPGDSWRKTPSDSSNCCGTRTKPSRCRTLQNCDSTDGIDGFTGKIGNLNGTSLPVFVQNRTACGRQLLPIGPETGQHLHLVRDVLLAEPVGIGGAGRPVF